MASKASTRDLRLVEDCLFEIQWRPASMANGYYHCLSFADQFEMSDLGRWLRSRGDDYAVLVEKSGRVAYLKVWSASLMRLLLLRLGEATRAN